MGCLNCLLSGSIWGAGFNGRVESVRHDTNPSISPHGIDQICRKGTPVAGQPGSHSFGMGLRTGQSGRVYRSTAETQNSAPHAATETGLTFCRSERQIAKTLWTTVSFKFISTH